MAFVGCFNWLIASFCLNTQPYIALFQHFSELLHKKVMTVSSPPAPRSTDDVVSDPSDEGQTSGGGESADPPANRETESEQPTDEDSKEAAMLK